MDDYSPNYLAYCRAQGRTPADQMQADKSAYPGGRMAGLVRTRGYFEIGIYHGKTAENIGTLWRSAYQLGAAGIFTIGSRIIHQSSDTCRADRHIPLREFATIEEFEAARPSGCQLIGVEMGGRPLSTFSHPSRAIYILGAEDHGLPAPILARCQAVVSIESMRTPSYNVAVAGSLVMYHRQYA